MQSFYVESVAKATRLRSVLLSKLETYALEYLEDTPVSNTTDDVIANTLIFATDACVGKMVGFSLDEYGARWSWPPGAGLDCIYKTEQAGYTNQVYFTIAKSTPKTHVKYSIINAVGIQPCQDGGCMMTLETSRASVNLSQVMVIALGML